MRKICFIGLFFLSVPLLAQDWSDWGKNIVFSDTLSNAKKYRDLDKALERPAEVYNLDLYDAEEIKRFTEEISRFKNLRKLVLNNRNLQNIQLASAICSLAKLEYLSLSNFTGFDFSNVQSLQHLKYLELDGMELKEIPAGIFELQKLEVLNLSCNRLSVLPPEIGKLKRLMELELTSNCFTGIPEGLVYLPQLRYLAMNNAEKGAVPVSGNTVCDNTITRYPEVLAGMKNLRKVHCFYKVEVDSDLKARIRAEFASIKFD